MFKLFIFACFLALAMAKPEPGVVLSSYTAPVATAYTAPLAAYTAPLAYSTYTSPLAAYSAYSYAPYAATYYLR
ncbi:hypothetical protein K1T71_006150 [Dendrolimus kikuchii]|uniref:Uncharacterized protein n=1 Tax=Dendrolimus kikuchii TaxID=765133 RepID=A0ACC1D4K5_9NEOP|nr:hypothetical protein K1T71_006150 [Dendrolimus kikuchii]